MSPPTQDPAQRFVSYLYGLAERQDRQALAELRRSISTGHEYPAGVLKHVLPFTTDVRPNDEATFVLVGGLFSLHPVGTNSGSFGKAIAEVARERDSKSTEKRFLTLLDSYGPRLEHHIRQMVMLARSSDVALPWRDVITGLLRWTHPQRITQRAWARSYYGNLDPEATPTEEETA